MSGAACPGVLGAISARPRRDVRRGCVSAFPAMPPFGRRSTHLQLIRLAGDSSYVTSSAEASTPSRIAIGGVTGALPG